MSIDIKTKEIANNLKTILSRKQALEFASHETKLTNREERELAFLTEMEHCHSQILRGLAIMEAI